MGKASWLDFLLANYEYKRGKIKNSTSFVWNSYRQLTIDKIHVFLYTISHCIKYHSPNCNCTSNAHHHRDERPTELVYERHVNPTLCLQWNRKNTHFE